MKAKLCEARPRRRLRRLIGQGRSTATNRTRPHADKVVARANFPHDGSGGLVAHNARCSNAKSPPRDCTCDCGGVLHGGGGHRLLDGPWARSVEYKHNDRGTFLGDSLDGPTVNFFDYLFRSSDARLLDDASDLIANEIADHLGKRRSKRFREELRRGHTICSLMVAMVSAMTKVGNAAPEAAREVVETVVEEIIRRRPGGAVGPLDAKTAGRVAKLVVGKLQATTTLGSLPLYIKACRYVAIVSCPAPADHNEIREYAETQVKEVISAELRDLLRETIKHWQGYGHGAEGRHNLDVETTQSDKLRTIGLVPPARSASPPARMDSPAGSEQAERFLSFAKLKRRLGLGRDNDGKPSKRPK